MPKQRGSNPFGPLITPEVLQAMIADDPDHVRQALAAAAGIEPDAVFSAKELLSEVDIPPDAIFEVKITLRGCRPAVTRTIAMPDFTLGELHDAIQIAMGWTNSHLHEFEVQGTGWRFGEIPDPSVTSRFGFDMDVEWEDEEEVTLSQLVSVDRRRLTYLYDFGDSWTHDILISKPKTAKPAVTYPCCLKGELACPPEDCGGIWGYLDLVDVLRLPKSERTDEQVEMLAWYGPFDPNKFDVAAVTKQLQKVFPPPKRKSGARKSRSKPSAKRNH